MMMETSSLSSPQTGASAVIDSSSSSTTTTTHASVSSSGLSQQSLAVTSSQVDSDKDSKYLWNMTVQDIRTWLHGSYPLFPRLKSSAAAAKADSPSVELDGKCKSE
jgi:hypothetical protein